MTRWMVGLLLLANILFFVVMRLGGGLMQAPDSPVAQGALNPEKILLVSGVRPAVPSAAASAVAAGNAASAPVLAASAAALVLSPVVAAQPKKQCMEWGEFSGNGLEQAQSALAALQLGDKVVQRSVEHPSGFWVYIPPQKNSAEVQRKIQQLKLRGISDYFVVQEEGAWLNALSLGVFRTEESAQKYLAGLRAKGVRSALVGERASKLKFTRFEIAVTDGVGADKVRALQKNFPDSEIKMLDCN